MEYYHIKVEVKDGVQVITLNRPEVLNSLHLPMARELQDALAVAAADTVIRAVLITGEGRGFCAGQDLAAVPLDESASDLDLGHGACSIQPDHPRHPALEKPVVCAVNGAPPAPAPTSRSHATWCSRRPTLRSSSRSAGSGSSRTVEAPFLLAWPDCRASGLALLGGKVSAAQARDWGLIWRLW
jgi:2-(1,2-epoxy-1,2-dihydrophenyl)acetyl-CoA isomerase